MGVADELFEGAHFGAGREAGGARRGRRVGRRVNDVGADARGRDPGLQHLQYVVAAELLAARGAY